MLHIFSTKNVMNLSCYENVIIEIEAVNVIENTPDSIRNRMSEYRLKTNDSKTEFIIIQFREKNQKFLNRLLASE